MDDLNLEIGLHQYIYNIGETPINLNWELDENAFHQSINPGDSACIKPFVKHNFTGEGKLLVLRIGGKISGDVLYQLSMISENNIKRLIQDNKPWFD